MNGLARIRADALAGASTRAPSAALRRGWAREPVSELDRRRGVIAFGERGRVPIESRCDAVATSTGQAGCRRAPCPTTGPHSPGTGISSGPSAQRRRTSSDLQDSGDLDPIDGVARCLLRDVLPHLGSSSYLRRTTRALFSQTEGQPMWGGDQFIFLLPRPARERSGPHRSCRVRWPGHNRDRRCTLEPYRNSSHCSGKGQKCYSLA